MRQMLHNGRRGCATVTGMQLTRLTIDNWRNFKHLDVPLSNRLIVVGPNASGKSNFLDVFRFLSDLASPGGGLTAAVDNRGGFSKIRSLFARNHQSGRVQIRVELTDADDVWEYFIAFKSEQAGKHRPVVDSEHVKFNGKSLLSRPDSNDRKDPELLTQTHLEQIATNLKFRRVAERLSLTSYLHLVPQIIRDPGRGSSDTKTDPFGGEFIAEINATRPQTRSARLRRMQEALRAAVPQFESLDVFVDAAGKPHLKAGYRNWRSTLANQTERDFSDGTLRLIGLLWALAKLPNAGGTLLLEEPELSLSSEVVRVLPTVLAQAQRNKDAQVVLTTHAPELIDDEGVAPHEVLVLQVTGDGSTGFVLSERAELVADRDDGVPTSDVIRPYVTPEYLGNLTRMSINGRGR